MSKLGKLLGKSKKIVIEDLELEIVPLKVKDMAKFGEKDITELSKEDQMKLNYEMIKQCIPSEDITDDEIESMSADSYMKLLNEIMELNGFGENESIKGIKAKIAEHRTK